LGEQVLGFCLRDASIASDRDNEVSSYVVQIWRRRISAHQRAAGPHTAGNPGDDGDQMKSVAQPGSPQGDQAEADALLAFALRGGIDLTRFRPYAYLAAARHLHAFRTPLPRSQLLRQETRYPG